MKYIVTILALPLSCALAQTPERPPVIQEQRGNITNIRVEGSLAPTQDLPCISTTDANPSHTPPDLHTGVAKCILEGDFARAARLFMLAGIYSRFDAERVADRTARGGSQVLIMRTFAGFSKEQKEEFTKAFNQLVNSRPELQAICTELVRIGPPSYFPKYLVLHGMNAFTSPSPLENALIPGFDSAATWVRLQDAYAHCPR